MGSGGGVVCSTQKWNRILLPTKLMERNKICIDLWTCQTKNIYDGAFKLLPYESILCLRTCVDTAVEGKMKGGNMIFNKKNFLACLLILLHKSRPYYFGRGKYTPKGKLLQPTSSCPQTHKIVPCSFFITRLIPALPGLFFFPPTQFTPCRRFCSHPFSFFASPRSSFVSRPRLAFLASVRKSCK